MSSKTQKEKQKNPCWEGYKMVGMKTQNSKKVPNCVPKDDTKTTKNKSKDNRLTLSNCTILI